MTVYFDKARKKWRFHFELHRVRRSGYCLHPETKKLATNRREAVRIEEAWRSHWEKVDAANASVVSTGFTLGRAMMEYTARAESENASAFNNEDYALELVRHFGVNRLLADIDAEDILAYRDWCKAQRVQVYLGGAKKGGKFRDSDRARSASTVNKYLGALEAAWRAAERRHRPKMPDFPACPEMPYLKTEKHLPNPVSAEHVVRILDAAPYHLGVTIMLAVHTSMRLDEVLALTWSEVRFDLNAILLQAGRTKARKGRVVQLTKTAFDLLEWLYQNRPAGQTRVVLYWKQGYGLGEPAPIKSVATAWRNVLKTLGLTGTYRFHDLRGAMGTFLANKVPAIALQRWLGHASLSTTMRYIEIADETQRTAAVLADGYSGTSGAMAQLQALAPAPEATQEEARRYVGVYPAGRSRYQALISITETIKGVKIKKAKYLGSFATPEEAARAYDAEARKYPGRRLNFPNVEQVPSRGALPTATSEPALLKGAR